MYLHSRSLLSDLSAALYSVKLVLIMSNITLHCKTLIVACLLLPKRKHTAMKYNFAVRKITYNYFKPKLNKCMTSYFNLFSQL